MHRRSWPELEAVERTVILSQLTYAGLRQRQRGPGPRWLSGVGVGEGIGGGVPPTGLLSGQSGATPWSPPQEKITESQGVDDQGIVTTPSPPQRKISDSPYPGKVHMIISPSLRREWVRVGAYWDPVEQWYRYRLRTRGWVHIVGDKCWIPWRKRHRLCGTAGRGRHFRKVPRWQWPPLPRHPCHGWRAVYVATGLLELANWERIPLLPYTRLYLGHIR